MTYRNVIQDASESDSDALDSSSLLPPLIEGAAEPMAPHRTPLNGVVIAEVVAIKDGGRTPLIVYPGQPGAEPLSARSVVDLHAEHIGKHVVVLFEGGHPARPIVMGVLREVEGWPLEDRPGAVEVEAGGERLIVSAKQQLVVRCGKASITLHRTGKVAIRGTHIVSHSEGVNRIRGGSVQLN
jgi:hypothetical protein